MTVQIDEKQPVVEVEGQEPVADADKQEPDNEQVVTPDDKATPTDETPSDDDSKTLSHEDAIAALKAVRKSEASMRSRLRETETKLEGAKTPEEVKQIIADAKAADAKEAHQLVIENVALKNGLPDDLAAVLQGSTREELEAHAKVLKKYALSGSSEDPDLSGGLDPNDEEGAFDPVATARAARKRRY